MAVNLGLPIADLADSDLHIQRASTSSAFAFIRTSTRKAKAIIGDARRIHLRIFYIVEYLTASFSELGLFLDASRVTEPSFSTRRVGL